MTTKKGPVYRMLACFLFILSTTALPQFVTAQQQGLFPVIKQLDYSDLNYRQMQEDVEFFHRAAGSGKKLPPLMFYSYTVNDSSNIFSIAAGAGLTYDTIASLNRISSSNEVLTGKKLILPSQPGIFLPVKPENDLEYIALSWRASSLPDAAEVRVDNEDFYFLPGESFHDVERAYFLKILFINPLPRGIVTSGYGIRKSPFTGHSMFHNGIDIAAPQDTPVYAARDGEVIAKGYNDTFGNYVEISHAGGYSSFYGHLNKIFVELHDQVNSTMIIAEVGTTGLSTGPHLHFEIRRNGKTRNPSQLTPGL